MEMGLKNVIGIKFVRVPGVNMLNYLTWFRIMGMEMWIFLRLTVATTNNKN